MSAASRYLDRARYVTRVVRGELRTARRRRERPALVETYLSGADEPKLQIGGGGNPLPGWLNTDLDDLPGMVFLDATEPFPFDDATFACIFTEHVIEHIPYAAGKRLLAECHRVLRPGGTLRVATPDLETLAGLLDGEPTGDAADYVDYYRREYFADVPEADAVHVVNHAMRAWGHTFLFVPHTMRRALEDVGFGTVRTCEPGKSEIETLADLEAHGRWIGDERVNRFETMVFEATR